MTTPPRRTTAPGLIALAVACAPAVLPAQEPPPGDPVATYSALGHDPVPSSSILGHDPVATFSILGYDPETGEMGAAVQSRVFSVGNGVLWAEAGVGAVATQAWVDVSYGPRGLALLAEGLSPEAVVARLLEEDPDPSPESWPEAGRQLSVMDAAGRVATHTGPRASEWAGHRIAPFVSAQGNILAGPGVVDAMVEAFQGTEGHLSLRLLAALEAGQGAGGDVRGMQSAAMLVVKEDAGVWLNNDVVLRLQVDDHREPIAELRRLVELAARQRYGREGRGDALLRDPDHPAWQVPAPPTFRARLVTGEGDVVVEVRRAWAPRGADRFYNLVRLGFLDDTRFFRVVEGRWAQFGVSGNPEVTSAWAGRTLPDDTVVASNVWGTLAYAMTGPDTRLTQIYVNLADNTALDDQGFAPFGRVVEGMDVVERLYAGYGDEAVGGMRAGRQAPMLEGGNVWLDEHFPEMDRILRAEILRSGR